MPNLLPPKEKKSLQLEQVKKLATILGFVTIISLICLVFILLSIKFYILSNVDGQKFLLQEAKKKISSI